MKSGPRPCTIVQGLWPDFGATLKIHKKSNFDRNQLKLLHNISTCICIRKCNKKGETSPCQFCQLINSMQTLTVLVAPSPSLNRLLPPPPPVPISPPPPPPPPPVPIPPPPFPLPCFDLDFLNLAF